MARIANMAEPVSTADGYVLMEVPKGNLGWVKDAPVRDWRRVTLVKVRGDGQHIISAVIEGPPDRCRQYVRMWAYDLDAVPDSRTTSGYYMVDAPFMGDHS